ncbi:MAG: hypothetical protein R6V67_07165 [Spirochaetia bacterium]
MHDEDEDIVYSTEEGDLRGGSKGKKKGRKNSSGGTPPSGNSTGRKHSSGSGETTGPSVDNDGSVKVRREKKGRKGKTVTAVYGVPLTGDELKELGKKLKQACGSGGSVKEGVIEIQGDETDRVIALLKKEGFSAKRAGG